jgi:hypothetical protein
MRGIYCGDVHTIPSALPSVASSSNFVSLAPFEGVERIHVKAAIIYPRLIENAKNLLPMAGKWIRFGA